MSSKKQPLREAWSAPNSRDNRSITTSASEKMHTTVPRRQVPISFKICSKSVSSMTTSSGANGGTGGRCGGTGGRTGGRCASKESMSAASSLHRQNSEHCRQSKFGCGDTTLNDSGFGAEHEKTLMFGDSSVYPHLSKPKVSLLKNYKSGGRLEECNSQMRCSVSPINECCLSQDHCENTPESPKSVLDKIRAYTWSDSDPYHSPSESYKKKLSTNLRDYYLSKREESIKQKYKKVLQNSSIPKDTWPGRYTEEVKDSDHSEHDLGDTHSQRRTDSSIGRHDTQTNSQPQVVSGLQEYKRLKNHVIDLQERMKSHIENTAFINTVLPPHRFGHHLMAYEQRARKPYTLSNTSGGAPKNETDFQTLGDEELYSSFKGYNQKRKNNKSTNVDQNPHPEDCNSVNGVKSDHATSRLSDSPNHADENNCFNVHTLDKSAESYVERDSISCWPQGNLTPYSGSSDDVTRVLARIMPMRECSSMNNNSERNKIIDSILKLGGAFVPEKDDNSWYDGTASSCSMDTTDTYTNGEYNVWTEDVPRRYSDKKYMEDKKFMADNIRQYKMRTKSNVKTVSKQNQQMISTLFGGAPSAVNPLTQELGPKSRRWELHPQSLPGKYQEHLKPKHNFCNEDFCLDTVDMEAIAGPDYMAKMRQKGGISNPDTSVGLNTNCNSNRSQDMSSHAKGRVNRDRMFLNSKRNFNRNRQSTLPIKSRSDSPQKIARTEHKYVISTTPSHSPSLVIDQSSSVEEKEPGRMYKMFEYIKDSVPNRIPVSLRLLGTKPDDITPPNVDVIPQVDKETAPAAKRSDSRKGSRYHPYDQEKNNKKVSMSKDAKLQTEAEHRSPVALTVLTKPYNARANKVKDADDVPYAHIKLSDAAKTYVNSKKMMRSMETERTKHPNWYRPSTTKNTALEISQKGNATKKDNNAAKQTGTGMQHQNKNTSEIDFKKRHALMQDLKPSNYANKKNLVVVSGGKKIDLSKKLQLKKTNVKKESLDCKGPTVYPETKITTRNQSPSRDNTSSEKVNSFQYGGNRYIGRTNHQGTQKKISSENDDNDTSAKTVKANKRYSRVKPTIPKQSDSNTSTGAKKSKSLQSIDGHGGSKTKTSKRHNPKSSKNPSSTQDHDIISRPTIPHNDTTQTNRLTKQHKSEETDRDVKEQPSDTHTRKQTSRRLARGRSHSPSLKRPSTQDKGPALLPTLERVDSPSFQPTIQEDKKGTKTEDSSICHSISNSKDILVEQEPSERQTEAPSTPEHNNETDFRQPIDSTDNENILQSIIQNDTPESVDGSSTASPEYLVFGGSDDSFEDTDQNLEKDVTEVAHQDDLHNDGYLSDASVEFGSSVDPVDRSVSKHQGAAESSQSENFGAGDDHHKGDIIKEVEKCPDDVILDVIMSNRQSGCVSQEMCNNTALATTRPPSPLAAAQEQDALTSSILLGLKKDAPNIEPFVTESLVETKDADIIRCPFVETVAMKASILDSPIKTRIVKEAGDMDDPARRSPKITSRPMTLNENTFLKRKAKHANHGLSLFDSLSHKKPTQSVLPEKANKEDCDSSNNILHGRRQITSTGGYHVFMDVQNEKVGFATNILGGKHLLEGHEEENEVLEFEPAKHEENEKEDEPVDKDSDVSSSSSSVSLKLKSAGKAICSAGSFISDNVSSMKSAVGSALHKTQDVSPQECNDNTTTATATEASHSTTPPPPTPVCVTQSCEFKSYSHEIEEVIEATLASTKEDEPEIEKSELRVTAQTENKLEQLVTKSCEAKSDTVAVVQGAADPEKDTMIATICKSPSSETVQLTIVQTHVNANVDTETAPKKIADENTNVSEIISSSEIVQRVAIVQHNDNVNLDAETQTQNETVDENTNVRKRKRDRAYAAAGAVTQMVKSTASSASSTLRSAGDAISTVGARIGNSVSHLGNSKKDEVGDEENVKSDAGVVTRVANEIVVGGTSVDKDNDVSSSSSSVSLKLKSAKKAISSAGSFISANVSNIKSKVGSALHKTKDESLIGNPMISVKQEESDSDMSFSDESDVDSSSYDSSSEDESDDKCEDESGSIAEPDDITKVPTSITEPNIITTIVNHPSGTNNITNTPSPRPVESNNVTKFVSPPAKPVSADENIETTVVLNKEIEKTVFEMIAPIEENVEAINKLEGSEDVGTTVEEDFEMEVFQLALDEGNDMAKLATAACDEKVTANTDAVMPEVTSCDSGSAVDVTPCDKYQKCNDFQKLLTPSRNVRQESPMKPSILARSVNSSPTPTASNFRVDVKVKDDNTTEHEKSAMNDEEVAVPGKSSSFTKHKTPKPGYVVSGAVQKLVRSTTTSASSTLKSAGDAISNVGSHIGNTISHFGKSTKETTEQLYKEEEEHRTQTELQTENLKRAVTQEVVGAMADTLVSQVKSSASSASLTLASAGDVISEKITTELDKAGEIADTFKDIVTKSASRASLTVQSVGETIVDIVDVGAQVGDTITQIGIESRLGLQSRSYISNKASENDNTPSENVVNKASENVDIPHDDIVKETKSETDTKSSLSSLSLNMITSAVSSSSSSVSQALHSTGHAIRSAGSYINNNVSNLTSVVGSKLHMTSGTGNDFASLVPLGNCSDSEKDNADIPSKLNVPLGNCSDSEKYNADIPSKLNVISSSPNNPIAETSGKSGGQPIPCSVNHDIIEDSPEHNLKDNIESVIAHRRQSAESVYDSSESDSDSGSSSSNSSSEEDSESQKLNRRAAIRDLAVEDSTDVSFVKKVNDILPDIEARASSITELTVHNESEISPTPCRNYIRTSASAVKVENEDVTKHISKPHKAGSPTQPKSRNRHASKSRNYYPQTAEDLIGVICTKSKDSETSSSQSGSEVESSAVSISEEDKMDKVCKSDSPIFANAATPLACLVSENKEPLKLDNLPKAGDTMGTKCTDETKVLPKDSDIDSVSEEEDYSKMKSLREDLRQVRRKVDQIEMCSTDGKDQQPKVAAASSASSCSASSSASDVTSGSSSSYDSETDSEYSGSSRDASPDFLSPAVEVLTYNKHSSRLPSGQSHPGMRCKSAKQDSSSSSSSMASVTGEAGDSTKGESNMRQKTPGKKTLRQKTPMKVRQSGDTGNADMTPPRTEHQSDSSGSASVHGDRKRRRKRDRLASALKKTFVPPFEFAKNTIWPNTNQPSEEAPRTECSIKEPSDPKPCMPDCSPQRFKSEPTSTTNPFRPSPSKDAICPSERRSYIMASTEEGAIVKEKNHGTKKHMPNPTPKRVSGKIGDMNEILDVARVSNSVEKEDIANLTPRFHFNPPTSSHIVLTKSPKSPTENANPSSPRKMMTRQKSPEKIKSENVESNRRATPPNIPVGVNISVTQQKSPEKVQPNMFGGSQENVKPSSPNNLMTRQTSPEKIAPENVESNKRATPPPNIPVGVNISVTQKKSPEKMQQSMFSGSQENIKPSVSTISETSAISISNSDTSVISKPTSETSVIAKASSETKLSSTGRKSPKGEHNKNAFLYHWKDGNGGIIGQSDGEVAKQTGTVPYLLKIGRNVTNVLSTGIEKLEKRYGTKIETDPCSSESEPYVNKHFMKNKDCIEDEVACPRIPSYAERYNSSSSGRSSPDYTMQVRDSLTNYSSEDTEHNARLETVMYEHYKKETMMERLRKRGEELLYDVIVKKGDARHQSPPAKPIKPEDVDTKASPFNVDHTVTKDTMDETCIEIKISRSRENMNQARSYTLNKEKSVINAQSTQEGNNSWFSLPTFWTKDKIETPVLVSETPKGVVEPAASIVVDININSEDEVQTKKLATLKNVKQLFQYDEEGLPKKELFGFRRGLRRVKRKISRFSSSDDSSDSENECGNDFQKLLTPSRNVRQESPMKPSILAGSANSSPTPTASNFRVDVKVKDSENNLVKSFSPRLNPFVNEVAHHHFPLGGRPVVKTLTGDDVISRPSTLQQVSRRVVDDVTEGSSVEDNLMGLLAAIDNLEMEIDQSFRTPMLEFNCPSRPSSPLMSMSEIISVAKERRTDVVGVDSSADVKIDDADTMSDRERDFEFQPTLLRPSMVEDISSGNESSVSSRAYTGKGYLKNDSSENEWYSGTKPRWMSYRQVTARSSEASYFSPQGSDVDGDEILATTGRETPEYDENEDHFVEDESDRWCNVISCGNQLPSDGSDVDTGRTGYDDCQSDSSVSHCRSKLYDRMKAAARPHDDGEAFPSQSDVGYDNLGEHYSFGPKNIFERAMEAQRSQDRFASMFSGTSIGGLLSRPYPQHCSNALEFSDDTI